MHKSMLLIVLLIVAVTFTGCVPGDGSHTEERPAGFFWAIWHGWLAPFTLLWGLLVNQSIRIYEVNNTGWWYDLGYYLAILGGFGGFSLSRGRKNKKQRTSDED